MKRALAIVLIAVMTAAVSGINDQSWARERQSTQAPSTDAHRDLIRSRALALPVDSPVEIEPFMGRKYKAILLGVQADAILIKVLSANDVSTRVVSLDEIKNIRKTTLTRSQARLARNILIGLGITAAVLVGACAIAVANLNDISPLAPSADDPRSDGAAALP
jgi:hypothetical protein